MTTPKPVVLCILDGWGISETDVGNAPVLAKTPTFDEIMAAGPVAKLITHGPDVGLPTGQMGNSEVGHTNIGAGRVVAMTLGQIDLAIENGVLGDKPAIADFINTMKTKGGTAHLMGVVSDGGVHGHIAHVIAAVDAVVAAGVPVVLHAITDGRDVAPSSADAFMAELVAAMPDGAQIGSVTGRYYALDRDTRWERVQTAYDAMVMGRGPSAPSAVDVVANAYAADVTDEFIPATVIDGYEGIAEGDGVFCLNFRADRAREIMAAIADPTFGDFDITGRPTLGAALGMVSYSKDADAYLGVAFPKEVIVNTLGEWVAKQGLRQYRLAETEKYPHVTFFLNGGKEVAEEGEDRLMPKSPKVATYDLQPEMSSGEVSDAFVAAIAYGYDLIVTNFANPDMVGHTGDLDAAIAACEAVDRGLARVVEALDAVGGAMIVTADHGNCEVMIDPETGGPHTAHTTNLVPVALYNGPDGATLHDGRLADLAPTLLQLMNVAQPAEMTGKSLID